MYAILRDRNGYEIDRCKLSDTDPLDCDHFAAVFSDYLGLDLEGEEPDSRIPDGLNLAKNVHCFNLSDCGSLEELNLCEARCLHGSGSHVPETNCV